MKSYLFYSLKIKNIILLLIKYNHGLPGMWVKVGCPPWNSTEVAVLVGLKNSSKQKKLKSHCDKSITAPC